MVKKIETEQSVSKLECIYLNVSTGYFKLDNLEDGRMI